MCGRGKGGRRTEKENGDVEGDWGWEREYYNIQKIILNI